MVKMGIEQEPTDQQKEDFEDVEVIGEINVEEFSGMEEKLSPGENVVMIAGTSPEDKDPKKIYVLTLQRLLVFTSGSPGLLGNSSEEFEDIKLDNIEDMSIEERKGFDIINIETKTKEHKLMAPEETAVKIAGHIRKMQGPLDPAEKLEKLSDQKDRGNITEEEFEDKKDELMDRI